MQQQEFMLAIPFSRHSPGSLGILLLPFLVSCFWFLVRRGHAGLIERGWRMIGWSCVAGRAAASGSQHDVLRSMARF
jgi:hypothetical protein